MDKFHGHPWWILLIKKTFKIEIKIHHNNIKYLSYMIFSISKNYESF